MKKSLLALAAMGAFVGAAHAQSSVTVYGILDVGYNSFTTDTTDASNVKTSISQTSTGKTSSYTSSRLGFRGTEDLGKGLRAGFNYELGIGQNDATQTMTGNNAAQTTVDSNFGNTMNTFILRQANVSLGGSFGTITLGRQTTAVENAWGTGDVGGANNFIGRAYTFGPTVAAATYVAAKQNNDRSDRLITYTSPNVSGFVLNLQYGDGKTDVATVSAANRQTELGASLNYTAGPLQVTAGYLSEKLTLTGANINNGQPQQLVLGANYDFKVAKAFALATSGSNKTAADVKQNQRDIYEIGVSVPVGAMVFNVSGLMGTYTPVEGADSGKASGVQVGALYNLSKRTMAYGVYGQDKITDLNTSTVNKEVGRSNFGIGIRHTF